MEQQRKKRMVLRLISILCVCAAILTVIPYPASNDIAIFGYKAICPFSPISTIITFYVAATIHRYLSNHSI